ncbi:MAG: hypothetical protein IJL87_06925 [Clostridia bacterium]|nr:hypothetical protein [Clostridia bacterium]
MKNERTLENLRNSLPGKIYLYLKDDDTRARFLSDARAEGCRFGKYGLPEVLDDEIISLGKNKQLSFLGTIGRIEFQCGGGSNAHGRFHRIDYAKYINGDEDFYFYNDPSVQVKKVRSVFHGTLEIIGENRERAAKFFALAEKEVKTYDEEEEWIDLVSEKYGVAVMPQEE